MPKLSIVVPVYNKAPWLHRQLNSILSQKYQDFELILVDDGSSDGSGEICDEYQNKDCRIRVHHQKNAGVSAARNAGKQIASGEFIGFMDADDEVTKDMYLEMMEYAEKEELDIVICGTEVRQGDKTVRLIHGTQKKYVQDSKSCVHDFLEGGHFTYGGCNKIYRASSIKQLDYCSEYKINEDKWFMFNAVIRAKRIGVIDKPLFINHRTPGSASRSSFRKSFFDMGIVARNMREVVEKEYPEYISLAAYNENRSLMELMHRVYREGAKKSFPDEVREVRHRLKNEENYRQIRDRLSASKKIDRFFMLYAEPLYSFLLKNTGI